jgi:predicted ferric reductase
MSPYLYPGRVASAASTIANGVTGRGILQVWDAGDDENMDYSHGLTGVDQTGNYLWVEVTGYLFLAVGLLCLGLHIFNMGWRQMRHLSVMADPTRQNYWTRNQTRWWPWVQRHIFTAPLWNKRHNKSFQLSSAIDNGTLPGRWHTVVLVIYVALNIAYCCLLPYDVPMHSTIAALRGRSGTLAALNLIPTILFALRNNPLIPLLQVSYDDFNLMHRWCARITILEAVVHTAAWLGNTHAAGGWQEVADGLHLEPSYTWGMVSTVAFVFLGIQAWSPIRHAFYETFLNIHRLVVIFTLVGLYKHLELHGLPQLPWMHIVIAMWSIEIFFRLVRITYNSVYLNKRPSRIRVEAMPGEAVRVTITLARPWTPRPGCHVHIYMPRLALWSSHPFSVAWSPSQDTPTSKELTLSTLEGGVLAPSAPAQSKEISLICRARTGLTRKMYDKAAQAPNQEFTTWGAIEGPYGGHHSLDSYGTVILFAGGVGITHQVMYVKHLVNSYHLGTSAIQKLVLVWTVPESECLEWVRPWMDEILRMPGRKKVLRVLLFITRPKKHIDSSSTSVKMLAGRPPTKSLLETEIKNRVGAVAVTVCGSGPFADDVRCAVRPFLTEGSVDFIEEAFTY